MPGFFGEVERARHVEALGDDDRVGDVEDRAGADHRRPGVEARRGPRRCLPASPRRGPAPCASCPARRRPRCGGRRRRGSSCTLPACQSSEASLTRSASIPLMCPLCVDQRPRHDRHFGRRHVGDVGGRLAVGGQQDVGVRADDDQAEQRDQTGQPADGLRKPPPRPGQRSPSAQKSLLHLAETLTMAYGRSACGEGVACPFSEAVAQLGRCARASLASPSSAEGADNAHRSSWFGPRAGLRDEDGSDSRAPALEEAGRSTTPERLEASRIANGGRDTPERKLRLPETSP